MAFFDKYPYTDFHEMNLDFVVDEATKMKKVREDTEKNLNDIVATSEQAVNDIKNQAEIAIQRTEGQAELAERFARNAQDYMSQASESAESAKTYADESKVNSEVAEDSAETCTSLTQACEGMVEEIRGTQTQIDLIQDRVNNIIPDGTQTEGNTELIDIRVDAFGRTFPSAGNAVREQIRHVADKIDTECVKTVNHISPDELGNVNVQGGGSGMPPVFLLYDVDTTEIKDGDRVLTTAEIANMLINRTVFVELSNPRLLLTLSEFYEVDEDTTIIMFSAIFENTQFLVISTNNTNSFFTTRLSATDVQINGTTITSEGVANIPLGGYSKYGVVRSTDSGLTHIDATGTLKTTVANSSYIKNRSGNALITCANINDVVKASLSDSRAVTFSPLEKVAVWESLGIDAFTDWTKYELNDFFDFPEGLTITDGCVYVNDLLGVVKGSFLFNNVNVAEPYSDTLLASIKVAKFRPKHTMIQSQFNANGDNLIYLYGAERGEGVGGTIKIKRIGAVTSAKYNYVGFTFDYPFDNTAVG